MRGKKWEEYWGEQRTGSDSESTQKVGRARRNVNDGKPALRGKTSHHAPARYDPESRCALSEWLQNGYKKCGGEESVLEGKSSIVSDDGN